MGYNEFLFREFNQGVIRSRAAYEERNQEIDRKQLPPDPVRRAGQSLAPCGTFSAYKRHVKYGEPVDAACGAACTKQSADRRAAGGR